MAFKVPNFSIAPDAPLVCRIAMKKAHIAHYEPILAAAHGRWYDQSRRYLEQLRADLAALEAQLPQALAPQAPKPPAGP